MIGLNRGSPAVQNKCDLRLFDAIGGHKIDGHKKMFALEKL